MDDHTVGDIARFFDREACCASSNPAGEDRLRAVSRLLLALVVDGGTSECSVLDAGCGRGALLLALGRRGVPRLRGIDLSPESIAVASRAAEQSGIPMRLDVANAATDRLEPHDVVVLDKVVCCYADVDALLANTVAAARRLVALSLPHSRGPRGVLARVAVAGENAWRRLRGDPFRAFAHDEGAVIRTLERRGFSLRDERNHWMWHIAVFERRP